MKHSFLPVAAAIALAATAHADTTELPPLVVTASRLSSLPAGTPVYVIDRTAIEQSTARNVSELLATVPGVSVRQLNGNAGTEGTLDIRGFGAAASTNTLILVDGRRLNDIDLSATDISGLALANIERIEVLPGGGSVLYGDGASGGTVNIITRRATKSGGEIGIAAGSSDTQEAHASGTWVSGPVSLRAFGQQVKTDGYRDNSELERKTIGLEGKLTLGAHQLYLLSQGGRLDSRLPGVRSVVPVLGIDQLHDDPQGSDTPNDYADEKRYQTVLGWDIALNDKTHLVLDGSHRHKRQKSFFDDYFGFGFSTFTDTTLDTLSLTPRLVVDYNTGTLTHSLRTGIDWYRTDYTSQRSQLVGSDPIHDLGIDSETRSGYLFQSSQWQNTTLTLGARQSRVSQSGRDIYDPSAPKAAFASESEAAPGKQVYREEMYEGGLSQELAPGLTLMGSTSRSVRFGTVDEIFEFSPFPQREFSPLRPQIGKNVEGSLVYQPGAHRFSLTVFRQKLRNEIHFNPAAFENLNLDPTSRKGATLAVEAALLDTLRLQASLTQQQAEFEKGPFAGKDIPVVSQHLANANLLWQVTRQWDIALSDTYNGSKRFDNDQSNTFGRKIPGYHRVDLRTGLRWKGVKAGVGVYNIGDSTDHYDYGVSGGSGNYNAYPLPGREYRADLSYTF